MEQESRTANSGIMECETLVRNSSCDTGPGSAVHRSVRDGGHEMQTHTHALCAHSAASKKYTKGLWFVGGSEGAKEVDRKGN